MFGFTASGARLTTSPCARTTNSERMACAACAASAAPQFREERQHPRPGCRLGTDEVDVELRARNVALPEREQQALDARAEANPRGGRAADLLDQAVVASAAADRVLRSDRLVLELEGRARVVVQPAH